MIKSLEYYADDGVHTRFDKYTIDTNGVIRNVKTDNIVNTHKCGNYTNVKVYNNDGKRSGIKVGRAIASTFLGPPPSLAHTADHENKNSDDDTMDNIRWLCKPGQSKNRDIPETYKSAFIVVNDNEEKTIKEWVGHLKGKKNPFGREYTSGVVKMYAQNKQFGFSYKEYPDLFGETWKYIPDSKGKWKISDMNRVKYITKHAENVLSGERLGMSDDGYPKICMSGKILKCHIISFMTFFPEEYANKKNNEMVLHEDDDRLDFRPHKLRLGTRSENAIDAYDNGKYEGTNSTRMKCTSYINGVLEKEHKSQRDAARYLIEKENLSASVESITAKISMALNPRYSSNFAYGRTWKLST